MLELWLSQHQHALGIDSAGTLDGLRDVFSNQAVIIIRQRVSALETVSATVQSAIKDWQIGQSDLNLSLWDTSISLMDIANGGKQFCDTITSRLEGKNVPFSRFLEEYHQWLESISEIEGTTKSMRDTKWEDVLDDVDDDDGLLDDKQMLLSKDDPSLLEEELLKALTAAYSLLESALQPSERLVGSSNLGQKGVFLLRVWRNLRHNLPKHFTNAHLGLKSVSKIQDTVVEFALSSPLTMCSKRLVQLTRRGALVSRDLWEGAPELSVLTSPWTYCLLLEVVQSMSKLGVDIWSPDLSTLLKGKLAQELSNLLHKNAISAERFKSKSIANINESSESHANGAHAQLKEEQNGNETNVSDRGEDNDGKAANEVNGTHINGDGDPQTKEDEAKIRDLKIQRLFDVLYLAHATSTSISNENDDSLVQIQASLKADLELETKALDRLNRNAGDYWKRTKLLFALL